MTRTEFLVEAKEGAVGKYKQCAGAGKSRIL